MAECSFVRCVQERRAIKKELQRWTKNMVFVVGLERVAEELMGRRKWKKYQDLVSCHTSVLESSLDETKDWEPQDKCCLCDEKTFLDRAPSPVSDQESSTNDSIYCESPPVNSLSNTPTFEKPPTMTTFESVKLAAIAALNRSSDTPPSLTNNMFYPPGPGGLFAPWYLPPTLPPHLGGRPTPLPQNPLNPLAEGLRMDPIPSLKQEVVNGPEQPLDLSAKATPRSPTIMPASPQSLRVPNMDNKHIFKAKPRMSAVAGRRTYTEDELQAALRDIQSGKLGTRRAAVIYGIPRSTLRNKVYKLAMERERDAQLLLNAPSQSVEIPDDDDKELSAAEEEREVEKALRQPLLSMEDLVRFSMLESGGLANPEALRHLLQQGKLDGTLAFPQGDVWGGLEHSALGPYISQLLAAGKRQDALEHGESLPSFPTPLLPDLVRRMMVKEKLMMHEQFKHAPVNGTLGINSERRPSPSSITQREEEMTSDAEATPSNVILKIPSFKPTSMGASPSVSEPFPSPSQESSSQPFNGDSRSPPSLMGKGIGVSLRDVIAKSISQKFQQGGDITQIPLTQKLLLSPEVEPPFKRSRFSPPLPQISSQTVIKHNNNHHHHLDDRNAMKMSPTGKPSMSTPTSNVGGKGTRPKRGKYRNYDRDSLVEAVRAVQRGEMSVHRAGSYYGVPHSTLEYKVKERHLMRPRKRDPKPPMEELKRKDDIRLPLHDKPKLGPPKLMKPPFPTSPLQNPPNGLKIPPMFDPAMSPLAYSTPPPFPFWPPNPFHSLPMPEFPRGPNAHEHFLASQMMQRLQEESSRVPSIPVPSPPVPPPVPLGKNAREMAESLYDGTGTNGTFLDGIIRSSLEMGLPSDVTKESSSERAPENLSNKALLDQLCRNSRLTPLPIHDGSSSDDDSVKHASAYERTDSGARRDDFSPSSDDSSRQTKLKENMDEDDYYVKSSKDRFSDNDSRSKDSVEDFSEKEDREDNDESACDSKNILQKPVEVAAKDKVKEEMEEVEETEQQTTDTKSEIDT